MSTAASSSFDPELVDQTRKQLRVLVHEIEGLTRSDVSPGEFYAAFLNRLVEALQAVGGAVWTVDESGQWKLGYQINLEQAKLGASEDTQRRHAMLLQGVATSGQGAMVAPRSGGGEADEAGNPTEFLLLFGALKSDKDLQGIVEIFQRPVGQPVTERGYLRFLTQMCDLAGEYLKTHHLRLYADRQVMWTQLEQFTRLVHESLHLRQTAYTIANEGRRLIGCDRVTVALKNGRKCRVEAVSGQETMDPRSTTVTLLSELATVVVAGGDPLWYTGDTTDLPPQIEAAVEHYADEAHSKFIAVLPLKKPQPEDKEEAEEPEFLGALIIEQINDDFLGESMRRRIDVVAEHSSLAIANGREYHDLFLMPVWRAIGKSRWIVQARTLPKTLLIGGAILTAILALFVVPAPYKLSGKGTLEPVNKRDVFAGVDGVVQRVLVKHGQQVHKGDALLELRNTDLDVSINDVTGRLAATREQRKSAERSLHEDRHLTAEERERTMGQMLQYSRTEESLDAQLKLYRQKEEQLKVVSPLDGEVITWQLDDKLLNRPVEKGQLLLSVADPTGDWELEVHMPEDRMGSIARARAELHGDAAHQTDDLAVSYILATNPGAHHEGTVTEVERRANVQGDEGNIVLVRVKIDKQDLTMDEIRPGATITAKVDCGWAPVGYVWFHDLVSFVQSRILFRL